MHISEGVCALSAARAYVVLMFFGKQLHCWPRVARQTLLATNLFPLDTNLESGNRFLSDRDGPVRFATIEILSVPLSHEQIVRF